MDATEIRTRLEKLREDHDLPAWQDTGALEDAIESAASGDQPYILLERGHYGDTAVSAHDSPEMAGSYALNQEYAEDWSAEVLLDTVEDRVLIPETIQWRVHVPAPKIPVHQEA